MSSSSVDMESVIKRSPLDVGPNEFEVVAEYNNIPDTSDPAFFIEVLCDLKDEEYLLYGRGNSESPWSIEKNGTSNPGEGAEFLTEDEALQWLSDRSIEGIALAG